MDGAVARLLLPSKVGLFFLSPCSCGRNKIIGLIVHLALDNLSKSAILPLSTQGDTMIAYLHKNPKALGGGFSLKICARPCNGAEFQAGERIFVAGKKEARAICAARNVTPWNF